MADINPFANLTPDKTLQQQAINSGNNLANMQRGLAQQQMTNRGAMDRTNANNINARRIAGINNALGSLGNSAQGVIGPKDVTRMGTKYDTTTGLTAGQMLQAYAKAGVRVNDPDKVFDPSEGVRQKVSGGFILPSTSAAKAGVTTTDSNEQLEDVLVGGKPVGITNRKRSQGVKSKDTPAAKSVGKIQGQKELASLVAEITKNNPYFKGKSITGVKRHGPKKRLAAYIDGKLMYLDP